MRYRQFAAGMDEDTLVILDIACRFLVDYFGCDEGESEELIARLLQEHGGMYDEGFIHHESAYGVAAGAYYFGRVGGRRDGLRGWMHETGRDRAPAEALKYFREVYFQV